MTHLMRRFGFPFFEKFTRGQRQARSSRPSVKPALGNELLEKRELLAADLGMMDPSMAIFYALSRGGDAMMASMGAGTSDASQTVVADAAQQTSMPAFADAQSEAAAASAVASASQSVDTGFTEAEGAPADNLFEIPFGLDLPNGQNSSLTYDPATGELAVAIYSSSLGGADLAITNLRIVKINSAGGLFQGTPSNISLEEGSFDVFRADELTKVNVTPPFFGTLSFGQVLPAGLTEQQLNDDISVEGAPSVGGNFTDTQVEVDLQVTDESGNALTSVRVGDEFTLRAFVEDVSSTPLPADRNDPYGGLFSAYLDVVFNQQLAEPVGDIQYGASYTTAKAGTVEDGLLNEVGAAANSIDPLGQDARELFSIRMRATQAGTLDFTSDAPDILPVNQITLYDKNTPISEFGIQQDTVSVEIQDDPEAAIDLAAFAQALADSGAIMYGAAWCPACTAQKELFGDGQEFLPFVEVTNPDRSRNEIGEQNNIVTYPTWVFADDSRVTGAQSIEQLSALSGVAIPRSSDPIVIGLEDQTLLEGSPLHVPLNGYDPNGGALTYEITSSNPDLVAVEQTSGNRSLEIAVDGWGRMLFELFDDRASRATNRIATLAEDGFYDGLIFHRVIDNFMIQGGDPNGTGSGGSDLPDFDDQFHVDLQHNRSGILSMAKSQDDTNNSQFFITDVDTRHLDGNHTVFGQLIEGDKNRDAINNTATTGNPTNRPLTPVTIGSATVIEDDTENGLLMLRAVNGATSGTSDITVKVTDEEGNSSTETFTVTLGADTGFNSNTPSWLDEIPQLNAIANETTTFNLQTVDVEGDTDNVFSVTGGGGQVTIDSSTGEVTVTPTQDSLEDIVVTFEINAGTNKSDSQEVTIAVVPATPSVDLSSSTDTGVADNDDITNAVTLDFDVSNVQQDATVELFILNDDDTRTKIGEAVDITSSSVVIGNTAGTLADDGDYRIVARQTVSGDSSQFSDPITVTVLRDVGEFQTTAPTDAVAGTLLTYDADHDDEGENGFSYSLVSAPTGVTIDASTGVLEWNPSFSQGGVSDFAIRATDIAGNAVDQTVSIDVDIPLLVEVTLELTDVAGNLIEASRTDSDFVLNVYVDDLRTESDAGFGVTSAYIDINYDASLVALNGDITYGSDFANNQTGDTSTAGLIDEAGASTASTTSEDRVLLMSIPMKTTALGTVSFTAAVGDSNPFGLIGYTPTIANEEISLMVDDLAIVNTLFAQDDTFTVDEDSSAATFDVLVNDLLASTDDTLTITAITNKAADVNAVIDGDKIVYTPAADFSGAQTFDYEVFDGTNSSTASVTVNVTGFADAPVASDDAIGLTEDSVDFALDVLANDTDADGDDLTITSIDTAPTNGTAEIAADGKSITYNPAANYNGEDSVTYTITDATGLTSQATATLTVVQINDDPVVGADTFSTDEDTPITISFADLLSNDNAGPNEEGQTIDVAELMNPVNGTVERDGTSGLIFTPDADFSGTATFEYEVRDNGMSSTGEDPKTASGLVAITVSSVNDAPVAVDDSDINTSVSAGTIMIDVLSNDTDVDDSTLTIDAVGTTSDGGTVAITDGQISYTPADGFDGTETFTYTISDAAGLTSEATVSVEVVNFVEGGLKGSVVAGSRGLTGVPLFLTGTTDRGDAYSASIRTQENGAFDFAEILPGEYVITQEPLPFLVGGAAAIEGGSTGTADQDRFSFSVNAAGLGNQQFQFTQQGLDPRFAIWEALASFGNDGAYAAVAPGESQMWAQTLTGWDDMSLAGIAMSADGSELTITAVDSDGARMEAKASTSDTSRIRAIGKEGNAQLIRIVGGSSAFNFTAVAEGENDNRDAVFAGL